MRKIFWDESFSVGDAELDGHHQQLAKLINRLADHLESPSNAAAVGDILIELADYASYHFKREEELMARCGFPHVKAHRGEHLHFYEAMMEISYGATLGIVNIEQLFTYLNDWWTHHIMREDKKYKPFLEAAPRAS